MASDGYNRIWRNLKLDTVAVGSNWTFKADGRAVRRIVSLAAQLVTSAVVANRRVTLGASSPDGTWYQQQYTADQVASTTTTYAAFTSAAPGGTAGATLAVPVPHAGLLLLPGHTLAVTTSGLDVGDQWQNICLLLEEVPSDRGYVGDLGSITLADLEG